MLVKRLLLAAIGDDVGHARIARPTLQPRARLARPTSGMEPAFRVDTRPVLAAGTSWVAVLGARAGFIGAGGRAKRDSAFDELNASPVDAATSHRTAVGRIAIADGERPDRES